MLVKINEASERPIYAQIADAIRDDIARGRIVAGATLPAARRLAEALNINVHTVLKAYQHLRDERLVDLRRGRGAVVTDMAATLVALRVEVEELVAHARELGVGADTLAALVAGVGAGSPPPTHAEPIPIHLPLGEERAA